MRLLSFVLALVLASPCFAQLDTPPKQVDLAPYAKTVDLPAAVIANSPVKSVNAFAPDGAGNVSLVCTPGFVNNCVEQTVAALQTAFPCTSNIGKYAKVSDLWGSIHSVMVCETDGTIFYWRPQRTDYAVPNTATSGTVSLTPLVSAPVQVVTSTLLGNMNLTPSATNAWPGAQFTIINKGVLGIFGLNVTGLTGGSLSVLAGGQRTVYYSCTPGTSTCAWQGY